MLTLLDELLATVLGPAMPPLSEVSLAAPDDAWRAARQTPTLSVYLVEVRENRKLRSNERTRQVNESVAYDDQFPMRLDCHYLISAHSLTSHQIDDPPQEHDMLYKAVAALAQAQPLNASRVYLPNDPRLAPWGPHVNDDLPTTIAPPEGFPRPGEFWQAMGHGHRWRPTVYLIVTIPVGLPQLVSGPLVTTRITVYEPGVPGAESDVWIEIGGTVRDATGSAVVSALVAVLDPTSSGVLRKDTSNARGRFRLGGLSPGAYVLQARASDARAVSVPISVPSTSGNYDLQFT